VREPVNDLFPLVLRYLCELVRIDTTNPPGHETAAARYLQAELSREGITSRIYEPEPGRGNLIARLSATEPAGANRLGNLRGRSGPLVLLSHLDVVAADPSRWRVDPFGGVIRDGAVWGRGTLDCKGPAAVFAALLIHLQRSGLPRYRDVVLVATADGESAGRLGMGWLARHHPEEIQADAALAQGGGWPIEVLGKAYFGYQAADKGSAWVRIVAHGQPGHGGRPNSRNSIVLLSRALATLAEAELPIHVTPSFQGFVEELAATQTGPASSQIRSLLSPLLTAEAASRVAADEGQRDLLMAFARNTFTPTSLRAGLQGWVAPDTAEAVLDCRILPGQTADTVRNELEAVLGRHGLPFAGKDREWGLVIEAHPEVEPSESPPHTDISRLMSRALKSRRPSAHLAPIISAAGGGLRFLRASGAVGYGFFPVLEDTDYSTIHGVDERISLDSLNFALQVLGEVTVPYVTRVRLDGR